MSLLPPIPAKSPLRRFPWNKPAMPTPQKAYEEQESASDLNDDAFFSGLSKSIDEVLELLDANVPFKVPIITEGTSNTRLESIEDASDGESIYSQGSSDNGLSISTSNVRHSFSSTASDSSPTSFWSSGSSTSSRSSWSAPSRHSSVKWSEPISTDVIVYDSETEYDIQAMDVWHTTDLEKGRLNAWTGIGSIPSRGSSLRAQKLACISSRGDCHGNHSRREQKSSSRYTTGESLVGEALVESDTRFKPPARNRSSPGPATSLDSKPRRGRPRSGPMHVPSEQIWFKEDHHYGIVPNVTTDQVFAMVDALEPADQASAPTAILSTPKATLEPAVSIFTQGKRYKATGDHHDEYDNEDGDVGILFPPHPAVRIWTAQAARPSVISVERATRRPLTTSRSSLRQSMKKAMLLASGR
jgi:hypothetical protein